MRALMTICIAAAALAIPAGALAHDGHGQHHHFGGHHHASLAQLSGTGTSFGGATATATGTVVGADALSTGTFSATLSTNWTAATSNTSEHGTLSCAPSTAILSVVGATTTNTLSSSLTGKTCAWTKSDGSTVRAFFGNGTVAAAGALAALNGQTGKAFLFQKADGTVKGGVFAGMHSDERLSLFAVREHDAAQKTGNCDHTK
jgi:hypothetical protein